MEIKLRQLRGKWEAALKEQEKHNGAERQKEKKKRTEAGRDGIVMKDAVPTREKGRKRKDEPSATPPVTKIQIPLRPRKTPTGSPRPVKNRKTTNPTGDQYASMKAFVVHGVPCQRPINDTIQDLRRAGMKGIRGARWLRGENRRINKATSSVFNVSIGKNLLSMAANIANLLIRIPADRDTSPRTTAVLTAATLSSPQSRPCALTTSAATRSPPHSWLPQLYHRIYFYLRHNTATFTSVSLRLRCNCLLCNSPWIRRALDQSMDGMVGRWREWSETTTD